jgi:hypothetical protein
MSNFSLRFPPGWQDKLRENQEAAKRGLLEHIASHQPAKQPKDDRVYPTARASDAFLRHIGVRPSEE